MPQESLGFVKLEWVCPKCQSRNPGPEKVCLSCGAPQPDNVQFQQAEQQQIVTDEKEIAQAKIGPDIHCGFCGTRNPADAVVCSQCGADLKQGVQRETGKVVGAYSAGAVKQVACPNCGTMNPETALKCAGCGASLASAAPAAPAASKPAEPAKLSPVMIAVIAAVVVLCLCVLISFVVMSSRTEGQNGTVESVRWTTRIAIEALRPAEYQGWKDEIPSDATIGDCVERVHHVQDQPAPNSNKVCGTPYTVDKGSGFAEVVQDCQYEVLLDYCEYTVIEWQRVDVLSLQGSDTSPVWPQPQLLQDQREGGRQESYSVVFETDQGQYTYEVGDYNLFQQFQIGSEWILNINGFGQVVSVEPAR
ncbi:MAG: zinc ribbon domain-containing protein [Anaerolineales bacterium]|nr:zinc ribbon domain-containing protein [Anaerolineales bacterium]